MGSVLSNLINNIFYDPLHNTLMIGLDNAGKTTILYNLKLGENVNPPATIGFNMERIKAKKSNLLVFDVGGQPAIRKYWQSYYDDLKLIISVVDVIDQNRYEEAKKELHNVIFDERNRNIPVLIYINKMDLYYAGLTSGSKFDIDIGRSRNEIESYFELFFEIRHLVTANKARIVACSAQSGENLEEGLDWASKVGMKS
ncbi:MAG: hypothetical protein MHMPM18_000049 [Marteilia pararefringens]